MLELLKVRFMQFMLGYVFILSGTTCYSIMTIFYPMRWIGLVKWHRDIVRLFSYLHWSLIPMIGQWYSDIQVYVHAHPDVLKSFGKEKAIVVINHKYHLDWIGCWIMLRYYGILQDFKSVVKKALLWIPIIGWSLWHSESVFMERNVKTDRESLRKYFKNLSSVCANYWLVLFCEGTRITPAKHKVSVEYALKKGIKPLKHHLIPRTKGFSIIRKGLDEEVHVLYDITVICPGDEIPTLSTFVSGQHAQVDILIRRIPLKEVPYEEDGSAAYLENLYQEKDRFCDFYIKNQRFPTEEEKDLKDFIKFNMPRGLSSLLVGIGWSILFVPPLFKFVFSCIFNGFAFQSIAVVSVVVLPFAFVTHHILSSASHSSSYGHKNPSSLQEKMDKLQ